MGSDVTIAWAYSLRKGLREMGHYAELFSEEVQGTYIRRLAEPGCFQLIWVGFPKAATDANKPSLPLGLLIPGTENLLHKQASGLPRALERRTLFFGGNRALPKAFSTRVLRFRNVVLRGGLIPELMFAGDGAGREEAGSGAGGNPLLFFFFFF